MVEFSSFHGLHQQNPRLEAAKSRLRIVLHAEEANVPVALEQRLERLASLDSQQDLEGARFVSCWKGQLSSIRNDICRVITEPPIVEFSIFLEHQKFIAPSRWGPPSAPRP